MKGLLSWNIKANVMNIPYRHDQPFLHENITFLNKTINKMVQRYRGYVKILNMAMVEGLNRSHYTKQGLHLNKASKRLISARLAELVLLDLLMSTVSQDVR